MKLAAIVLIVAGILLILIRGFNVPVKKDVANIGPIEISKTEKRWIGWPTYTGGVIAALGIVLLVYNTKRK